MWEHAFYLDYKNVKADYTKAFWNVINWDEVQSRYAAATSKAKGLISGLIASFLSRGVARFAWRPERYFGRVSFRLRRR